MRRGGRTGCPYRFSAKSNEATRNEAMRNMEQQTVLYLHGFASSAQSTKARYLREKFRAFPQVEFHTEVGN